MAQGLRLGGPALAPSLSPTTANTTGARSSDFIVAVVDSEPITNQELQQQVEQTVQQLQQQQGSFVPRREVLVRQVLERLIDERAQLRLAQDLGIRIEDSVLEQAEQGMATQNGVSMEAFRERLAQQGMSQTQFRADLRQQLTLQRLREREVNARIRITEPEIDKLLAERIKTSQEAEPVLATFCWPFQMTPVRRNDKRFACVRRRWWINSRAALILRPWPAPTRTRLTKPVAA